VGKKKSKHRVCRKTCDCDYIFSREIPAAETTLRKDEIDRMKKGLLYAIEKDNETGEVKICPMNEENCIVIHGAEEVAVFIYRLLDHFQT